MIECFLTNLYSIDVMAPFCLEMKKRGIDCHLALDELFWKISYGKHFDIKRAIQKAKEWNVELNLRLNYDAKIAVTQWTTNWMLFSKYKNLKAHISYGVSINKYTSFTGYKNEELKFDIFFIHGDFEEKLLLKKGIEKNRIIKIGFPKLKYQKMNFKIEKKKPVITYLSTWDEYKAIDIAIEKLLPLQNKYDIFVKPHSLQKEEDLEKLKIFNLLPKEITVRSIVNISDYIFTDLKSGVFFDCVYFDFKNLYAFSYKNQLKDYYDEYKNIVIFTENDNIDLSKRSKIKKEKFFKDVFDIEKVHSVDKISSTSSEKELDILIKRLEKVYKDLYRTNLNG